jgi:NhaA family Na+:H+ antiporter
MKRAVRIAFEYYLALPLGGAIALVWANVHPATYFPIAQGLAFLVNDVGMAFALAYVAQEVIEGALPGGALYPLRRTTVPIIASIGGTLGAVAAYVIFIRLHDEQVLLQGYPIACGVDVLYCLALGRAIFRRSAAVTFLLMVAIVSDIVGLALISPDYQVAYSVSTVPRMASVLFLAALGVSALLRGLAVRSVGPYVVVSGSLSWAACYLAGLHPAIALLPIVPFLRHTPRDLNHLRLDASGQGHESATHFEYLFRHPMHAISFLFGFVNTGVLMRGIGTGTWAVLFASIVGRPIGILAAIGVALALGLELPRRVGWKEILVISLTVSLTMAFGIFLATGVFPDGPLLIETKMGAISTIVGVMLTLSAARLLHVGRFATIAGPRQRVVAQHR